MSSGRRTFAVITHWRGEGSCPPRWSSGKGGWLTKYRGSHEDMHLEMFREQLQLVTGLATSALGEGAYSLFMVVFNQLDAVGHHFPRHANPLYPTYDPKR